MDKQPMLSVSNLTVQFGNLIAVNNVKLDIYEGEIVGLIGPNGAGKTTCFNALSGLQKPQAGKIVFKGRTIVGVGPHKICKLGMSRTFQVIRAFNNLTVEDAIRVGAYNRTNEKNIRAKVENVLGIMGLIEMRGNKCGDLGLATLRRIEIARAIATEPDLLLLDETGAGLNPNELANLMTTLKILNKEHGITLCVVEHIMQMVMGICTRIFVLDTGELIAAGTPEEISNNERVIEAYLGKRAVL